MILRTRSLRTLSRCELRPSDVRRSTSRHVQDVYFALSLSDHLDMALSQLLRRQWESYPRYHQSRPNLLIHIFAVPLFLVGTIALVAAATQLSLGLLAVTIGCVVVSIALQGRGHRLECVPPEPFSGPLNFVARLFFEQWVTFPRFVLSGGWRAALAKARAP